MSSVNAQTQLHSVSIAEYEKLDAGYTFRDTVLYRPRIDRTAGGRVRMARRSRSVAAAPPSEHAAWQEKKHTP